MATRLPEREVSTDFEALKRQVDDLGPVILTREGRRAEDDLIVMTVDQFLDLIAPSRGMKDLFVAAALDRGGGG